METVVETTVVPKVIPKGEKVIRTEGFYLSLADRIIKLIVRVLVAAMVLEGTQVTSAVFEFLAG